ncbi:MAG: bleomycin resistance protein [Lachnospiraceae bacterium]
MKFNSLIPELSVSDIERTKKFYIDILGFKIEYERPEDLFMFVSKDDCQLMFEQVNGNWNVGELVYPFGRGINLEMTVLDVDSLYRRVLENNIPVFREMKISEYRENDSTIIQKEFLIQDPDGYLLRFTD